ncbi:MAG: iron-containing redox enzyme family protein [Oculatellaceae cyanobacterium bins.114]|nr:iron-containing redox enzyme family protein [Oculatellaceae cyanobacterium bins.114]
MQSNLVKPLGLASQSLIPSTQLSLTPYDEAELIFANLIELDGLDTQLQAYPSEVRYFETALNLALKEAYQSSEGSDAAHRFIQRVLYRINRLNLFWYDALSHYTNERSPYLHQIRDQIERVWQAWELQQIDVEALKQLDVKQALSDRGAADLDPPLSPESRYIQEQMSREGYRYLLAIASFDGLVEASRLSRILGGAANEVQATLTKVLLEEYGNGRLNRKHSTFFAQMMTELELSAQPEAYFDLVPWQVLASINHNFLLTECKRHFLRYNGGLAYFEVVGPSIYKTYLAAAQRLELSEGAMGYWDLHIREDERHGRWMIDNVVLPLVDMYPQQAWQIVLGYDQEKRLGDRAGVAVVDLIQRSEHSEPLPIVSQH